MSKHCVKRWTALALTLVMALSLAVPAMGATPMMAEDEVTVETPVIDTLDAASSHSHSSAVADTPAVGADDQAGLLAAGSITLAAGDLETAYVQWTPGSGVTRYDVYVAPQGGSYTKLDDQLIRSYPGYMRADALGLKAGTYTMKVVPDGNESQAMVTDSLTVVAHERKGFAFVNGTASGAYNDDGTLKSKAQVLYVTKAADIETYQSNEIWSNTKNKYTSDPMCVRVIGHVELSNVMGFQDWTTGLTIEGVGNDAIITGGGVFVKGSSNVEVRNLGVMHVPSSGKNDLIAVEQTNDHIWVHNCDLFYGFAGSGDQAKGDGSLDVKDAEYCSFSYNHFWDSGKCSLLGNNSSENYITYHHNWFDHSDSRHPRTRGGDKGGNVHVYNNYYDGNSKYGVGNTSGKDTSRCSIFVEANYFRNTKYPILNSKQGSDSDGKGGTNTFSKDNPGFNKAYNNVMVGSKNFISQMDNPDSFDAYVVSTRDEKVPSSVNAGGSTYNNFDTTMDLGVEASEIQNPQDAVVTVTKWAGRVQGGDIQYEFDDAVEDTNYSVIDALNNMLNSYKTTLVSIGGTVNASASGGTHTHTPGAWQITKTPGCDKNTQALVDGEETQYCTTCGEVLGTRTVPGQHSNDGTGKCTNCGYETGNGGGPVVSANSKTLKASQFTMNADNISADGKKSAFVDNEVETATENYFHVTGNVMKRNGNGGTPSAIAGTAAEFFEMPKSDTSGFSFAVSSVPAKLTIEWGSPKADNSQKVVVAVKKGDTVLSSEEKGGKSNTTTLDLTEAGTYLVTSSASAGYSARIMTISVTETITEAPDHQWGDWVVVREPTCGDDGLEQRKCAICGTVEEQFINPTGEHTWGPWSDPDANGKETRTCTVCGEEDTQTVELAVMDGKDRDLGYLYVPTDEKLVITGMETGDTVLAATYDASGRLTGVAVLSASQATREIAKAARLKLFWVNATKPMCDDVTVYGGN